MATSLESAIPRCPQPVGQIGKRDEREGNRLKQGNDRVNPINRIRAPIIAAHETKDGGYIQYGTATKTSNGTYVVDIFRTGFKPISVVLMNDKEFPTRPLSATHLQSAISEADVTVRLLQLP